MALHKQKIHSMHSQIDTSPPASMALAHMRRNLKQEKLVEDRWQEIERSNHILVRRMREIMSGDGKYRPLVAPGTKKGGYRPASLNYRVRRAREVRIQAENRAIIRRLCASRSAYAKEDMRPCNFQPHFLPKLPLSKLGAIDSRSALSRMSVVTEAGGSAGNGASLGSLSARAPDRDRAAILSRPVPLSGREPAPAPRASQAAGPRLLSFVPKVAAAGAFARGARPGEAAVLVREALKVQDKYIVASLKQTEDFELRDAWTVEFYVPEDAVTISAAVTVEEASDWLEVLREDLVAHRSLRPRDEAAFEARRAELLSTLVKCYETRRDGSGAIAAIVLARPVAAVRGALAKAAARGALADLAATVASRVVDDVVRGSARALFEAKAAYVPTVTLADSTATKLQLALRAQCVGTTPGEFLRRYDRDGSGVLDVPTIAKIVRRDCKISAVVVSDMEISLFAALMDEHKSGTVAVSELSDFVENGLYGTMLASDKPRQKTIVMKGAGFQRVTHGDEGSTAEPPLRAPVVPAPPEGARSSLARGRPAAGRKLKKKGAPGSPRDDASAATEKTAGAYSRASARFGKPARSSRAGPPPKHHLDEPTLKRVRGRLKQACNGVGPLEFLQRFDAGRGALSAGEFKALLRRDLKISFADLGEDDATSLAALLDPDKTGFLAVPGVAHFIQAGVLPAPLLDGPLDDVSALTADTAPPKVSRTSAKKKPAPPNGARNAAKGGAAGSPARKVRTPAPDLSAWALRGRASRKVATADGDVHYLLTLRVHPRAKRAVVVAVNASTDETMSVELGRKALGDLQVPHDANVAPDALGAAFAKALRSAA